MTHKVMTDPVIAADGHTYERMAIVEWLETHDTSPLTNDPLPSKVLFPNLAFMKMIRDWKD